MERNWNGKRGEERGEEKKKGWGRGKGRVGKRGEEEGREIRREKGKGGWRRVRERNVCPKIHPAQSIIIQRNSDL